MAACAGYSGCSHRRNRAISDADPDAGLVGADDGTVIEAAVVESRWQTSTDRSNAERAYHHRGWPRTERRGYGKRSVYTTTERAGTALDSFADPIAQPAHADTNTHAAACPG